MKKILLFILLASIAASAQVTRYDNFAATTTSASGIGNLTQVIPNATLQVFNAPGAGVSCVGGGCVAAITYTSRTGAVACGGGLPLTRPTATTCLSTADSQGNFGFWASAGTYQYCVSAPSFTTQCYNAVLGATTAGADNVQYVSTVGNDANDGLSPGGAKASILAAFNALGASGGRIQVASGNYTQALGTLSFTKSTRLICEGIKGTTLTFTGASGAAIIFSADSTGGGGGSFVDWAQGMENCQVIGPGGLAGTANAGTGIQVGDATHQAIGVSISRVVVAGFTTGITWGNAGAWGTKVDHSSFIDNTQDLLYNTTSGGTENIDFYHDAFGVCGTCGATLTQRANGVQIAGTTPLDIAFDEPSFDNDQFSFTSTSALAKVTLIAPHFETGATISSTTDQLHVAAGSGSGILSVYSPVFLWDPSSGSVPAQLVDVSAGNFIMHGGYRASTNITIANAINASGGGVFLEGAQIASGFTNPNNIAGAGWYWSCPDASQGGCTSNLTGLGGSITGFSLVSITAIGGTPTVSGTGACATSSTQVGGKWAGLVTCTAATAASTLVITPGITAPHGFRCPADDQTTNANKLTQSTSNTTTCTIAGTVNQNDVIAFGPVVAF